MRATLIKLLIRAFLLAVVLMVNNLVVAKPAPQPQPSPYFTTFDSSESGGDGGDGEYYMSYGQPISDDYRIRRLRRGFYYIDDGYITPVAASSVLGASSSSSPSSSPSMLQRRQSNDGGNYYRPQHAKHKKLFVPNLYG